jgi:hypothetical protein
MTRAVFHLEIIRKTTAATKAKVQSKVPTREKGPEGDLHMTDVGGSN